MAELKFRLFSDNGSITEPKEVFSYELSRDADAPCDSLRLCFLYSGKAEEFTLCEVYDGNGLIFCGLCDMQREENEKSGINCFIYARSSACILTDSEAEPYTYESPSARSLFIINAEKFGFTFDMDDVVCKGKYVVSKGCSCYSAINRLVLEKTGRSITVTPDGRITQGTNGKSVKIESTEVISERRIINRGAPVSQIDYKTASDGAYSHHIKSRFLERKGISRRKKVNLSALFDWQREGELKNILRSSAAEYDCVEIVLASERNIGLYESIEYADTGVDSLSDYRVCSVCISLDGNGAKTRIRLTREIDLEEIMYVD